MHVIFTDLDGTLLDHDTYSIHESLPGIGLLAERGYPLILVSSKTLPEMAKIHAELRLTSPFVFENGGGFAYPSGNECIIERAGPSAEELRSNIPLLLTLLGAPVRLITDMPDDEIVMRTGLSSERAIFTKQRISSVPFIIDNGNAPDTEKIQEANNILSPRGIMITRGGRFFHLLSREAGKGNAVRLVKQWYSKNLKGEHIITAGIGDSDNDIPMLRTVDMPFLVRKKDGNYISTGINGIRVTRGIGPAGFTEAVKIVCGEGLHGNR